MDRWSAGRAPVASWATVHDPRFVALPGGRLLAYDEHGDPTGPPVLLFHGSPGSRLDFLPSAVMPTAGDGSVGGRFIAVDRPGVGASDHLPGRRLTDWADDVAVLADHLGIDRFAVLGYSGGGAYALQVAHGLPDRVAAVSLVGSLAPPGGRAFDDGTGLGPRIGLELARSLGRVVELGMVVANRALAALPDLAILVGTAEMCAADRQLLSTPALRDNRVLAYREAARHGTRGPVHDVGLVAGDWGFDLGEVDAPVTVWAGADDNFVPLAQTRHLVEALPRARLELLPHAGHTVLFSHGVHILGRLVAESANPGEPARDPVR